MDLTKQIDIFGQETILELLEKRSKDFLVGYRRNLALIGSEFCGKTTLITHWIQRIYEPNILPVYITINKTTYSQFAKETIKTIFIAVFKKLGKNNSSTRLEDLTKELKTINPKIAEKGNNVITLSKKRSNLESFKELMLLLDTISIEMNLSIVFVLEEFHNLEKFKIKNLFKEWGKTLCLQKNVLYVISSSSIFKAKRILDNELRLLFGNFEIIELEHLSQKNACMFIKKELFPYEIEESYLNFILDITDGCICYLRLISEQIKKNTVLNNNKTVTSQIIKESLTELLFADLGIINQLFTKRVHRLENSKSNKLIIPILVSLANGHKKIKELLFDVKSTQTTIKKRLAALIKNDFISANGNFYTISDRFFSLWLKTVYSVKKENATDSTYTFLNKLNREIELFMIHSKQKLFNRIEELFSLFSDGTIEIESKSFRLTHFHEIKPMQFTDTETKDGLIARAAGVLWLTMIKPDGAKEEDVIKFSLKSKKFKKEKPRKILISCKEIDANTKIRAKQENITAIDIDQLNRIFNLHERPSIIAKT